MLFVCVDRERIMELIVQRFNMSCFFFSSRRRHTRLQGDWSSDVCSSDLPRFLYCQVLVAAASQLFILPGFRCGSATLFILPVSRCGSAPLFLLPGSRCGSAPAIYTAHFLLRQRPTFFNAHFLLPQRPHFLY